MFCASKPKMNPPRTSPDPGRGERCRRIAVDDGAAVGRRNDGVGALQYDDGATAARSLTGARQFVARGSEDAFEFTFMRRDDAGSTDGLEQFLGV